MIDRKTETFLSRVNEARATLDNLKTTQPIGADLSEIRLATGTLEVIPTFNDGQRIHFTASYSPSSLKEWQDSTYNEIRWGIFIGAVGAGTLTRYDGSLVNVLPTQKLDAYSAQAEIQIVNVSGVAKQVAVRPYVLTTAMAGSLNSSWYIE